jgi:hypothetical protein
MSRRSESLAKRLEQGADALAAFAANLNDSDWNTPVPRDGRTVGVCVHHVADIYPLEMHLAGELAAGKPIQGVTWGAVAEVNAKHAKEHAKPTKAETLDLLKKNSRDASKTIRGFSDEQLDGAAPVSLYFDAPMTLQFWIEDHPMRHSYHHLGKIRGALGR